MITMAIDRVAMSKEAATFSSESLAALELFDTTVSSTFDFRSFLLYSRGFFSFLSRSNTISFFRFCADASSIVAVHRDNKEEV